MLKEVNAFKLEQTVLKQRCLLCNSEFELSEDFKLCPADGSMLSPVLDDPFIDTIVEKRYHITEHIASGGTSKIYKAKHLTLDKYVVLKVLQCEQTVTERQLGRFKKEAQVAMGLVHPNIVRVYDYGIFPQPYISMEYVPGQTLASVIKTEGPLPTTIALPYFIQICEAMSVAHKAGLIHRDLKPSNVMVDKDSNQAKVLDFGLVKDFVDDSQHTHTGEMVGSPAYMSPEQCRGAALDARSDIYSLGCLMYEVLTGMPPFSSENTVECIFKHLETPAPSLKKANKKLKLSAGLEKIISNCLAKEPQHRYQSMDELKKDLVAVQSGRGRTVKILQPKHFKQLMFAATFLPIGLVIGAALFPVYQELTRPQWDKLGNDGIHLAMDGRYKQAIPLLLTAKSKAEAAKALPHKIEEIYYWLGITYVNNGSYEEGKDSLENTLKLSFQHEEDTLRTHCHEYLATAYAWLKNHKKALEHASAALDISSRRTDDTWGRHRYLYSVGDALFNLQQYDRAIKVVLEARQSLATAKKQDQSFLVKVDHLLGHIYASLSRHKEAFDAYGRALALGNKLNHDKLLHYIDCLVNSLNSKNAQTIAADLARQHHWPPYLTKLIKARLLIAAQSYDAAIEHLTQARQLVASLKDKDYFLPIIDLLLGDLNTQQNHKAEALSFYGRAFQHKDKFNGRNLFESAGHIAALFVQQDGIDKVIELSSQYHWPLYNTTLVKARTLMHLQQYDQAIEELSKAINLDPKHNELCYCRGFAYFACSKFDQAIPDWQKFAQATNWYPTRTAILINLAYRFQHNTKTAQKLLAQFPRKEDSNWPYPAIKYLRKEITADQLIKFAGKDTMQITEAYAYIGANLFAEGKYNQANKYLQWVREHGRKDLPEYDLSIVLFKKLSS